MEDKILEIIKEESENANVRKYTCINGFGYSQFERNIAERVVKLFCQPVVIGSPIQLVPVLAEIEHINDLGKSKWYEVVYFWDENWRSYADSKTFQDGEKVIKWKYVKDCL